jgi:hypothetical protein
VRVVDLALEALEEGPPGWFWASALTATIVVSWFLAGADVKKYFELWKECGAQLLTFAGSIIGVWLAYKGFKGRRNGST